MREGETPQYNTEAFHLPYPATSPTPGSLFSTSTNLLSAAVYISFLPAAAVYINPFWGQALAGAGPPTPHSIRKPTPSHPTHGQDPSVTHISPTQFHPCVPPTAADKAPFLPSPSPGS